MDQNRDPNERLAAAKLVVSVHQLRAFLETVDDLSEFEDPVVFADLAIIMAILEGERPKRAA